LKLVDEDGDQIGTESLTIDLETISDTAFELRYFMFTLPAQLPEEVHLSIQSSNAGVADWYLDSVLLIPVVRFNGIDFAVFGGATSPNEDDKFIFSIIYEYVGAEARTAAVGSTATSIIFTGADYTLEFPVGSYVYHPTGQTWHQITASSFSTDTTVTVAIATGSVGISFAGEDVIAQKRGFLQEFLGRLPISAFDEELTLPSSADPDYDD
jgi:hypothetical protein